MYKSTIKAHGPSVDGRMIAPGIVIYTQAEPPAHWRRFADMVNDDPAVDRVMVVNPAPVEADEAALEAEYRELAGDEPDGRWSIETLRKKVEELR